ncbi:MAG: right-handed parallel beta-helix repeat-containing protein, partial [Thermoplasmata archaeon]|nr:right-handed parallel beta-helix repeat-containing protein [Thermoplasmata archaeon]
EDDDVIRVSSDNVTIKGFTITGSTSKSGIYANGVENLRVENCIFNDNYIGILCENGTTARINWNEIEANSEYGIRNLDLSSEKIDAENNWWGDENGPGGAGPGTGDKVSWNVDFVPWIGGTIPRFKQQQVPAGDEGTIDAKNETDAEIDYETSKPATITVFRYNENPGDDGIPDDLGKYIDVSIDDPSALVEMMIRFYYNETELGDRDETTLRMYWWNGDSWNQCSDTGVNTTDVYGYAGYVWARILGSTDPNLPRLYDPPFGIGGESGGPITRTVEVTIDDIQEKIEPNASITVSGDITITPSGNVQNVGIYLDEVFYENATFTNSNYTYILTLPAELAESAHTIMVKVTLETGETGTENKTIIYEPEPVEHTITITIDEITEKIKPGNEITVSGTITVVPEAEIQIIKILLDGTEAATATLDGSRYSGTLTLPEDLTEGKHTITVNATIITGESDEASTEINYKVSGDGDEGIGAAAIAGVVVVLIVVILIVLIMMGVISLGGKKGKEERMPEYPEEKETETRGKPEEKEQEKAEKPVEEKGERGKTETEKEASQKEEPITEEKERDGEC